MNMTFKKAFSDLKTHPGRTALVVFALVIGIWGVGSMLVSYYILSNDLNENYTKTKPLHAVLNFKDYSRLDIAKLRQRPEIESAEFRAFSTHRIEVYPDQWVPLWLFAVEDFEAMSLAKIYRQKGMRIPQKGSMLIERNGLLISNIDVGSVPQVRIGNRILHMPVDGVAFDPAQAPATQDRFIFAYVSKSTYTSITAEPLNQRLILRFNNVSNKADVQAAVDSLSNDFASRGIRLNNITIPKFNQHPHQWQLNTLLFLQGSISLLAFLMGGVLVSQLMASILARQVRQIGVLKAIGASNTQVLKIYLTMVLVLGLIAGVIAVPFAVLSAYGFSFLVAYQLNFDILTLRLPLFIYMALFTASLLLPLLFSLPALLKATRVSVHDALNDYGIASSTRQKKLASGSLSGLLSKTSVSLVMAFRNSFRQKRRLMVTVIAMALGVAIFDTGFNVRASLAQLLADTDNSMRHDVKVVLRDPIPRDQAVDQFQSIEAIERIETWNGGKGRLQSTVISTTNGIGIVALPYDSNLFNPIFTQGRWLSQSHTPEIVINQQAWEQLGFPAVGSEQNVMLGDMSIDAKLIGVIEEFDVPKIYMDQTIYDSVVNSDHTVNSLMFVAKDNRFEKVMLLKQEIEKIIAKSDLNVLYVMSQAERVKVIYDHLNIILTTIVFLAFLVLLVSALGMASAMGINIMERTREIGVLRAVGATPVIIHRIFLAEGMIISTSSILLGLILAWPLSEMASVFFGNLMLGEGAALKFVVSFTGLAITVLTTIIFAWLASRIPARNAIHVTTQQALAYE